MENQYIPIVSQFLRDNPRLFKESTPEVKLEMAEILAGQIQSQVRMLTPYLAEPEIKPEMTPQQIEGVTNMAKMRAEGMAYHEIMYSLLEPH